jgi:hypothetical protein
MGSALIRGGLCLAVVLVALLPRLAAAERDWNRLDDPLAGAVGLHAGLIGGMGLAYKYPPVWWLNFQMAGGIWHTAKHKRHNIGLQLQYILRQDTRMRLYSAAGAGYFYHKEVHDEAQDEVTAHWNTGFGIGVEFLRGERVSIQLEGDFTHEGDDGDILFYPQVGIFYYF